MLAVDWQLSSGRPRRARPALWVVVGVRACDEGVLALHAESGPAEGAQRTRVIHHQPGDEAPERRSHGSGLDLEYQVDSQREPEQARHEEGVVTDEAVQPAWSQQTH